MWGKGQEEWHILGVELGADVDDGLGGGCRKSCSNAGGAKSVAMKWLPPNETGKQRHVKAGGNKSIG